MRTVDFTGTVSHATMRNEDLIPSFLTTLEEFYPEKVVEFKGDEDYYYVIEFGHYDTETAHYLLEEMFDAMNEIAPSGFYFGAHPGDGCDYGYWTIEEEF